MCLCTTLLKAFTDLSLSRSYTGSRVTGWTWPSGVVLWHLDPFLVRSAHLSTNDTMSAWKWELPKCNLCPSSLVACKCICFSVFSRDKGQDCNLSDHRQYMMGCQQNLHNKVLGFLWYLRVFYDQSSSCIRQKNKNINLCA